MDTDGDFIITWQSYWQDRQGWGIYAKRYDSTGMVQGSEFQINTFTSGDQLAARAAMDNSGNFVVTWMSNNQDNSGWGSYAQRFNSEGAVGSEFRVNSFTAGGQLVPRIIMDSSGNFVETWMGYGQEPDESSYGIFCKRYNSNGVAF
jgi:hypothetical protein